MKIEFSKDFEKSVKKLSGKMLSSVKAVIQEVIEAKTIDEITDCKKLVNYDFIYRIRIVTIEHFLYSMFKLWMML